MTETPEPPKTGAPDVRMIPIALIEAFGNVREVHDEGLKELVASIKSQGLLESLVVTPRTTKFTGQLPEKAKEELEARSFRYRLVFGFRRLRACQLAGLTEVKAEIRDMTPEQVMDAQLVENEQREDLNAVEEARGFKRRLAAGSITQKELGGRIGKSQPFIANRLRLLELRPEVQESILRGILSPSQAEVLLAIPKEASGLQGEIAKKAAKQNLPVKDLERQVEYQLQEWKHGVDIKKAIEEAKKAGGKVLSCPFCESYVSVAEQQPEQFVVYKSRPVLQHKRRYGYETHRWDAVTGERVYSPEETKELERRKAQQSKVRREAAKKAKSTVKVERDYAVVFTRSTAQEWAAALLKQAQKDIEGLDVSSWGGFTVESKSAGLTKESLAIEPVDVPDGNGGEFHTRVRIGSFASGPTTHDDVAEGSYVKDARKARGQVLAFQQAAIGWKQSPKAVFPSEISGFKLGQKVRIGAKSPWQSYVGKQGVILALDYLDSLPGGGYNHTAKKEPAVVLDIAASHKVFWLSSLEHVEAKKT